MQLLCSRRAQAAATLCTFTIVLLSTTFLRNVARASSWDPTLLVNTEAFQVIDDADTTNIELRFGETTNEILRWDNTNARFLFTDDVHAEGNFTASGTLTIQGNAKIKGNLSGSTISGGGLYDCEGTSNKVTYDSATSNFKCEADQTGAGGGMSFSEASSYFVNDSGDSMTGGLLVETRASGSPAATIGAGLQLEIVGTGSGDHLHAQGLLTSSGAVRFSSGVTLNEDLGATDVGLVFGSDTVTERLDWVNAADRFEFSDDLRVTGGLYASGGLVVEAGQTVTLNGVTYTFPAGDGSASGKVLKTNAAGQLSWSTDSGGGGASLTRIAGSSGAAGADITWQNLTADSATCITIALCAAAIMTTTGVGVGTWKFTYTLIYQSAATTTGIGFGINHTGTVGQFQARWTHMTTGGSAATGIGDSDTTTVAGQLAEGKHDNALNAVIGSASAGVDAANADITAILQGIIVVTGSGNLELKIASEVASSAVKVMADSTLELLKIE